MTGQNTNATEFTVSELSSALKRTVEDVYGYVRVRGELGRVSRPGSGHVYLDLKDERSVLSGVIWKGVAGRLAIQPEQGLEVIATGKLTTFPGQSKYQMVIDHMEPAGVGALMALLEERKKKLAAEGLFDESRKQLLPFLPRHIGVVTSPTGAVIRDILHRLTDRYPVDVTVWPVRVQGDSCSREVANGIRQFNALPEDGPIRRPDLIIVARGGGSLEDLWGFNEEEVVRAAADSLIPLISAVGHETDWTLIDYVADRRAPTPTGAAEMAVPVRSELVAQVDDLSRRLQQSRLRHLERKRQDLRSAARALPRATDLLAIPQQRFDTAAGKLAFSLQANTTRHRARFDRAVAKLSSRSLTGQVTSANEKVNGLADRALRALSVLVNQRRNGLTSTSQRLRPDTISERIRLASDRGTQIMARLDRAFPIIVERKRQSLNGSAKLLNTLSYQSVLKRGFALVRDEQNMPVRSADQLSSGDRISIEFADGVMTAAAGNVAPTSHEQSIQSEPETKPKTTIKKQTRTPVRAPTDDQGSLF